MRPQQRPDRAGAIEEFRRLNPWFEALTDAELESALVVGEPGSCRERLLELAETLRIDQPILDLSGLDAETARRNLDAFPPGA